MPESRAHHDEPSATQAVRHGRRRARGRSPLARLGRLAARAGRRPLHQLGLVGASVLVAAAAVATSMTGEGVLPREPGASQAIAGTQPSAGTAVPRSGRALPGDVDAQAGGDAGSPPALASPSAEAATPRDGVVARRIRIARLGIDLAIVEGDGVDAPATKAAHYPGTAWPGGGGNIYLYAHARAGLFLPLWDARVGDTITLDLAGGGSASYVVSQVLPSVPWNAMEYTDDTAAEQLTLQTCTGTGVEVPRFIVIAVPS